MQLTPYSPVRNDSGRYDPRMVERVARAMRRFPKRPAEGRERADGRGQPFDRPSRG